MVDSANGQPLPQPRGVTQDGYRRAFIRGLLQFYSDGTTGRVIYVVENTKDDVPPGYATTYWDSWLEEFTYTADRNGRVTLHYTQNSFQPGATSTLTVALPTLSLTTTHFVPEEMGPVTYVFRQETATPIK